MKTKSSRMTDHREPVPGGRGPLRLLNIFLKEML